MHHGVRRTETTIEQYDKIGEALFRSIYGETADSVQNLLDTIYPDMASDSPRQIQWHLDGARRRGATFEEIQAVRAIAMEVAKLSGIKWRDGVPEVEDTQTAVPSS
ncbi:hypothetical protein DXG01_008837 [Tephrocybe rancida]|nr:hypothetical protein DXG01_008837 [Tephrocybe rancida]